VADIKQYFTDLPGPYRFFFLVVLFIVYMIISYRKEPDTGQIHLVQ
jgi:hypothetical protein